MTLAEKAGSPGPSQGPPRQMKNFVLDTNVLLHDPRAIFQFADNTVVIPIYVLEEIDQFKKELSERGRNAREVARLLDELPRRAARACPRACRCRSAGGCGSRSATRALPTDAARESQIADNLILGSRSRCATPTRTSRRSSSPRTSTCASAPTRSGCTPRTTRPSGSTSRSSTRATRAAGRRRRRRHASTPQGTLAARPRPTLHANQYLLLRDRDNPSHTALGRYDGAAQEAGAAAQAARGRLGHPPAQQGAALRARPAAQRRHQAGHAGRQGRHRQDLLAHRRRPAEGASRRASTRSCSSRGRSSRSAATSATCPATSRRS